MFATSSLEKHVEYKEFVNLTDPEERIKLESECGKLKYLMTYPSFVQTKINEKNAEIRSLDHELSLDIASQSSELHKIKRLQELKLRYYDLQELREELLRVREELIYAEKVKVLAETRLNIYEKLLNKQ